MADHNKHMMPMQYMKKEQAKYLTAREETKKKKTEDLFKQAFNSEPIVVKKEKAALDSSEALLESSIEEGQSYIEEGKAFQTDQCLLEVNKFLVLRLNSHISDVKADVKSALERLNNDKIIMLERKVRTLERNIKASLDEKKSLQTKIDTLELDKVENDLRVMELEEQLKFQEEMLKISTEDVVSNAIEKGAPEVAEIGVQTEENSTSEVDVTVKKEVASEGTEIGVQTESIVDSSVVAPEVTEKGAQTERVGNPYDVDKDATNAASDGLKDKLEEAYKIVVMQESSLNIKEKEIGLLKKKIRDWGLEDKLSEESTPRRRTVTGVREDIKNEDDSDSEVLSGTKRRASSLAGGEAKLPKTPKKDIKIESKAKSIHKTHKKGLKENRSEKKVAFLDNYDDDEDEFIVPDTDPKHPTSSFKLRKKGRTHRGKKALIPMGRMLGPFTGNIENIIVDKGDDPKSVGVDRYFAIRRGEKSKFRNPSFRNAGPRVSSWKEYRSKYVN